jgi:hypothetical protein
MSNKRAWTEKHNPAIAVAILLAALFARPDAIQILGKLNSDLHRAFLCWFSGTSVKVLNKFI